MATVNVKNVNKLCGKHSILNQINLNIEKGEFVAVVGPSGSGKSTLLRLVAGLDRVSSGHILINGQCVNEIPAAKRNMAMVFQNYALYPHMTVYANMAYGLKRRGIEKKEIHRRVEEVGRLLQIHDYFQRKPASLSGGQRQRVAMGRAIVRSPAVFLFDEPLSNLDAKLRTEMRHEIKKLHHQLKATCLYVTHDQTEAMTLADRVVVLNRGHVEQIDSPRQLYQNPASLFVASFIGHYPMNFLPAKLNKKEKKILTNIGIELPLPLKMTSLQEDDSLVVGIRPEHIVLAAEHQPESFTICIEMVDDLGADRLIQGRTRSGVSVLVRLSADTLFTDRQLNLKFMLNKASLFSQNTGKRLGDWDE